MFDAKEVAGITENPLERDRWVRGALLLALWVVQTPQYFWYWGVLVLILVAVLVVLGSGGELRPHNALIATRSSPTNGTILGCKESS